MHILTLILAIAIVAVVCFTVTFTIITFYIASKRRVRPKYHFTGIDDLRAEPDTGIDKSEIYSSVDNESAKREWERANRQA